MNEKEICFIINTANDLRMQEIFLRLKQLNIPEGVKVIIQRNKGSNTSRFYNEVIKNIKAKYKIYLDETTIIVNENLLIDLLTIFRKNPRIGILGAMGSKRIPTDTIWWHTKKCYGKVYNDQRNSINMKQNIVGEYENVAALWDGMIATQYDLNWSEEFMQNYFAVLAHNVNFLQAGYEVGVVNQKEPWCICDKDYTVLTEAWKNERELFLNHYSSSIFPLVSICIPTHNRPEFFKQALESVLNQSYRNLEIVISDNSTDEKTNELIQRYLKKDRRIRYFHNPNFTAFDNWSCCINNINEKSEYGTLLCDDDLFLPEKISVMIDYYLEDESISLVTSYRQSIDKEGKVLNDIVDTQKIYQQDSIIGGQEAGRVVLKTMLNLIGEHSTLLLKREDLFKTINLNYLGGEYKGSPIGDVINSLSALLKGKLVYLTTPFSCFRRHEEQSQNIDISIRIQGLEDWWHIIKSSYSNGVFLHNKADFQDTARKWLSLATGFLHNLYLVKEEEKLEGRNLKKYLREAMQCALDEGE